MHSQGWLWQDEAWDPSFHGRCRQRGFQGTCERCACVCSTPWTGMCPGYSHRHWWDLCSSHWLRPGFLQRPIPIAEGVSISKMGSLLWCHPAQKWNWLLPAYKEHTCPLWFFQWQFLPVLHVFFTLFLPNLSSFELGHLNRLHVV